MIFPSLTLETIIQVEDKLRLDASLSFISGGGVEVITDVLIQPEAAEAFISVYNSDNEKWYLDWAYTTDEIKTVIVKVITDSTPVGRTRSYMVNAISVEDDALFSVDADLFPYEPKLIDDVPNGKNTFLYAHRKAQEKIIAWLDEQRIWKNDGSRYTKQDIALIAVTDSEIKDQFKFWSTFETLLIIFESNQVSNQDIFQEKRAEYENMRDSSRKRSALRLDADGSGVLDETPYDIRTLRMIRR
jgi:hypothetical protein